MKSKILTILFFGVGGLGLLLAQPSPVNNLCYDEEFTEKIAVVSGVDLSTLTILDKLKFEEKSHMNAHHEYLNGANNATHDVHYVSHENMFPKWYAPPTTRANALNLQSVPVYMTRQAELTHRNRSRPCNSPLFDSPPWGRQFILDCGSWKQKSWASLSSALLQVRCLVGGRMLWHGTLFCSAPPRRWRSG